MLPVEVMARYWPELGELVPTPGHRADARRRLYALVRRAEESGLDCDPNRLYVSAMDAFDPPLPEGGFGSCGRPPPTCSGRCRTRRRWPASPTG